MDIFEVSAKAARDSVPDWQDRFHTVTGLQLLRQLHARITL